MQRGLRSRAQLGSARRVDLAAINLRGSTCSLPPLDFLPHATRAALRPLPPLQALAEGQATIGREAARVRRRLADAEEQTVTRIGEEKATYLPTVQNIDRM